MTADDLLDPMIGPGFKGFPHGHAPLRRSAVAQAGWNVLAGDLPLPVAVLKRDAVAHNVDWLQRQARQWGIDLAPHGKTTMSPQLFRRQLDAGAWGITFATVTQLAVGVAAGVRRALIANQVLGDADLAAIQRLMRDHAGLRVVFLVDSAAQLDLIEAWAAPREEAVPFEVLLELGLLRGVLGDAAGEAALQAPPHLLHEPARLGLAGRHVEPRHVGSGALVEVGLAALGDRQRVVAGFRELPPQLTHLRRALQDPSLPTNLSPSAIHPSPPTGQTCLSGG